MGNIYKEQFLENKKKITKCLDQTIAFMDELGDENRKNALIKQKNDLESGTVSTILTRFPPEPNAYLHIGHARAIITNPKLILADEPTGALDSKSSKMLLDKFEILNKQLNATILSVTVDGWYLI